MSMKIEVSPEPTPNFTIGRDKWGVMWPLHYHAFGIIFAILMLYIINSIVALTHKNTKRFQRQKIFLFVNILLCFFCCVSSLSLLIDPYDSGEHIKTIDFRGILYLIIKLRTPCLTASFALIQVSLLEATKIQLYSKRLQSYCFIFTLIAIHFVIVMTADVIVLLAADLTILLVICQVFLLCLGLAVSITSVYTGVKVIRYYRNSKSSLSQNYYVKRNGKLSKNEELNSNKPSVDEADVKLKTGIDNPVFEEESPTKNDNAVKRIFLKSEKVRYYSTANKNNAIVLARRKLAILPNDGTIEVINDNSGDNSDYTRKKHSKNVKIVRMLRSVIFKDKSIQKIAMLTIITALFGMCYCCTMLFSLLSVFMVTNDMPNIWEWYILQTCTRFCELGMIVTMAYTVRRNTNIWKIFRCKRN